MKVFVVGCGGWGMALSILLHENGHTVTSWTCFEEECKLLREQRGNEKLLPGIKLPEEIEITTDLNGAAAADLVLMAVPSFAVHSTAQQLSGIIQAGIPIVNVGKGLDRDNGYCRFSETITRATNGKNPVVALTGPTHAEEVSRGILTCILAASASREAATLVQQAFMNDRFRVYISPDIIGAELGGCFKNIIALAAGICDGVGLGDNSKAALMTRGLTEIARLGTALGGRSETFAGLSGMGDLMVTCGSMHSRNRRAGILIGEGVPPEEAIRRIGTVEGYLATATAWSLAQETGVEMPITEQCYRICYENVPPRKALEALLSRGKRHEWDQPWLSADRS